MAVLERSELEASPLADLHAIADQLGLDGFRRLRKAALVDAILGEKSPAADVAGKADGDGDDGDEETEARPRRRRPTRTRRTSTPATASARSERDAGAGGDDDDQAAKPKPSRAPRTRPDEDGAESSGRRPRARGGRSAASGERERPARATRQREDSSQDGDEDARSAEGVVEVLGNGSAFLRVEGPEPSDQDVYISAAQVRRCELVSGDRVTGPVRTPRRSERYPSLVRVDTINGASADSVSDGSRYDDLPVAYPSERLALGSSDPTLEAIEWITPLGHGSRAVICGARHSGKSETLRRLLGAVHGRDGLEVSLVLVGARPEEIAEWTDGPLAPVAALSFAASADSQDQAVERAIESAKRVAARGGNALVLIDSLDGMHPHSARKALAAARNLREGGSLTIIATAAEPVGGETTVIALDAALTSTGRQPILDLLASRTLRPELLVGDDGAAAITKARAEAIDAG